MNEPMMAHLEIRTGFVAMETSLWVYLGVFLHQVNWGRKTYPKCGLHNFIIWLNIKDKRKLSSNTNHSFLPDCEHSMTSCCLLLPPSLPHHDGPCSVEWNRKQTLPSISCFYWLFSHSQETSNLQHPNPILGANIGLYDLSIKNENGRFLQVRHHGLASVMRSLGHSPELVRFAKERGYSHTNHFPSLRNYPTLGEDPSCNLCF